MVDHTLRAWDPWSGEVVGDPWVGHEEEVWSIAAAVLDDGTPVVFSGGLDGVRRWDARTGLQYGPPLDRGYGRAVALATTRLPNGRIVLSMTTGKGKVRRFDAATMESLGASIQLDWNRGPDGNAGCRSRLACLSTADGGLAVTSTNLHTIEVWDLLSGQRIGRFRAGDAILSMAAARLTDDSPVLLIADEVGDIDVVDVRTGSPVGEPIQPFGHPVDHVWPVTTEDERTMLVVVTADRLHCFDDATGRALGDPIGPVAVMGNRYAVASLSDKRTLLVVPEDEGIVRVDLNDGSIARADAYEDETIWDVATVPLPDGRVLIAGAGHDGMVYRWDAATGRAIDPPLEGHRTPAKAITTTITPDGIPLIISVAEGGEILRWHALTGEQVGPPLHADMDADGDLTVLRYENGRQVLVCVAFAGSIQQWDPFTGDPAGPTITMESRPTLVAAHVSMEQVPTAIVHLFDENYRTVAVERWRLDSATRVDQLAKTVRATFRHGNLTRMVQAENDGSVTCRDAPP